LLKRNEMTTEQQLQELENKVLALSPNEFGKYPYTKEALELAIQELQAAKDAATAADKPQSTYNQPPSAWYHKHPYMVNGKWYSDFNN
jgi:hypothetical protein